MIGPSTRPMPPITVMKMTKAVQSLTLNAVSGEMRSFCRKINAPIIPVPAAVRMYTTSFVRVTSTPLDRAASSLSRIAVRASP
jgi:hypothetical protein